MSGLEEITKLTPQQAQAALLDATGHSVLQIHEATGTAKSAISKWRKNDDYKAAVVGIKSKQLEGLEPAVNEIITELTEGVKEAVATLRRNLQDDNGKVSNGAAVAIVNAFTRLQGLGDDQNASGGGTYIQVNVGDLDVPEAVRPAEEQPVIEVSATEVV